MASAETGVLRRRVNLSVAQKLDIIEKLEGGVSVSRVCEIYGVKKQTVSDIRKIKKELEEFALTYSADGCSTSFSSVASRKHMKVSEFKNLEEIVYKWFVQQRMSGVVVRSVDLKSVAKTLAQHMGLQFKVSDGWVWRFRKRHGLVNKRTFDESLGADTEHVGRFSKYLNDLIKSEDLGLSQLYNAYETGIFYCAVPENNQIYKQETGRRIYKERVSVLFCTNADGLHRLQPIVVGKAKNPRALRGLMTHLPVVYSHSKNACFTVDIFRDWFFNHFVPGVQWYQTDVLKIPPHDVKAVLLLDYGSAHPNADRLVSMDGRIKCVFLPPHTTSPLHQGVNVECMTLYKKFLEEDVAVLEDAEETTNTKTLENLYARNIRTAIFNVAAAWNDMKITSLADAWKNLLHVEPEIDCDRTDLSNFRDSLDRTCDKDTIENGVEDRHEIESNQFVPQVEILRNDLHKQQNDEKHIEKPVICPSTLSVDLPVFAKVEIIENEPGVQENNDNNDEKSEDSRFHIFPKVEVIENDIPEEQTYNEYTDNKTSVTTHPKSFVDENAGCHICPKVEIVENDHEQEYNEQTDDQKSAPSPSELFDNECHVSPKVEIVENDLHRQQYSEYKDEDSDPKLSVVTHHIDGIMNYIKSSSDPDVLPYYKYFREFRSLIIRNQQKCLSQLKNFSRSSAPPSPDPCTSKGSTPFLR